MDSRELRKLKKDDLVELVVNYETQIIVLEDKLTKNTVVLDKNSETYLMKFLKRRIEVCPDINKRYVYEIELDRLLGLF
tara:strand:+ start:7616 stop:7852 length:237 start_codon:yes stop_codon:yes gene_type:complete